MKKFIHIALTIISFFIVTLGLCTVEIESISLLPIIIFLAAAMWILHVLKKADKKAVKKDV